MNTLWGLCLATTLVLTSGCGNDLGDCNESAARELVYGRDGLVATKGQALMHDSCGNGAFCHSQGAEGKTRLGAPGDMNFDMLPKPLGWPDVLEHREGIWESVLDGTMPPGRAGANVQGTGSWSFEPGGASATLPSLSAREGKAAFRNWLACGAPVVSDTKIPWWAVRPVESAGDAGVLSDWNNLYVAVIQPRCASGGCHDAASAAGGLSLASECAAYEQLLASGACGAPRVSPGDGDSLLVNKVESANPVCGGTMPPSGMLADSQKQALRDWVVAGALAPSCK